MTPVEEAIAQQEREAVARQNEQIEFIRRQEAAAAAEETNTQRRVNLEPR